MIDCVLDCIVCVFGVVGEVIVFVVVGGVVVNMVICGVLVGFVVVSGLCFVVLLLVFCIDNVVMIGWVGIECFVWGEESLFDFVVWLCWLFDLDVVLVCGVGVKV